MKTEFKNNIVRNLLSIPGARLKRKIVVIESDDWGTIRMSSKEAFDFFMKKGLPVHKNAYNSYDILESNEDLELLFDLLSSIKDKNNNPARFTVNNIAANPDFEKIKASDFQNYFYEPFTETLKKYPNHDRVMNIYKQGINHKIVKPQFHGREHVNVSLWMDALQKQNTLAMMAFEKNMFSVHSNSQEIYNEEFMDSFGSSGKINEHKKIITDGLNLFERIWGFRSKSFIAPCYVWDSSLEKTLSDNGIKYIQGISLQKNAISAMGEKPKTKYHFFGQSNKWRQKYLIRNAFFEPACLPDTDFVTDALKRASIAFKWGKPVIIGTHRLNFTGSLNPDNRNKNLKLFKTLLQSLMKQWPDIEFMFSDELGDAISN